VLDGISAVVTVVVDALTAVLAGPPFVVWVLLLTVAALLVRAWALAVFTLVAFLLIVGLNSWQETMETLAVVLVAAVVATAVGVPLGIWAARSRAVERSCGRSSTSCRPPEQVPHVARSAGGG
jgi:glycine betaine/proline transport system permease protein